MINVINDSLTFWWLHCMHKLSPKWLLFYGFWQQMRRACIDQDTVCTQCVFWSKAAVGISHFISSLKAEHFITYLAHFWFSICPSPPPLFSLHFSPWVCSRLCACASERLFFSLKVSCSVFIYLFYPAHLIWKFIVVEKLVSPGRDVSFLTPKFKRNVTSRQRKRIELVPEDYNFILFSPRPLLSSTLYILVALNPTSTSKRAGTATFLLFFLHNEKGVLFSFPRKQSIKAVLGESSTTAKQSVPATAQRRESRSITGSCELEKKRCCNMFRRV